MRFHWLRNRVEQKQFNVQWAPGQINIGDYPTKHHSGKHHKTVRPIYLNIPGTSPSTMQGCVKILSAAHNK